jgi:hypothetical protein
MEMMIVVGGVALLAFLAVPSVRVMMQSFESEPGARSMINAAMASARAIAAKEHRYAGIRFQKAYHPQGQFEADQYMIFIVQDPELGAWFFRVVEGQKPIRLPESIGVMDLTVVTDRDDRDPADSNEVRLDDPDRIFADADKDMWIMVGDPADPSQFVPFDLTTFSIIFAPSGKLAIHGVRVRNRDGYGDTFSNTQVSLDDVFNKLTQVRDPRHPAMFYQDDYFFGSSNKYPDLKFGPEASRRGFVIYDREQFRRAYTDEQPWSGYLRRLNRIYINPYTGTLISQDR